MWSKHNRYAYWNRCADNYNHLGYFIPPPGRYPRAIILCMGIIMPAIRVKSARLNNSTFSHVCGSRDFDQP